MDCTFLGSLDDLPEEKDRLLLKAAERQDLAAVQQQLAAGANVRAVDSRGLTALHAAALRYGERMVAVLLDAGADASASSACSDAGALTPLLCMLRSKGRWVWCAHPRGDPSIPCLCKPHTCDGPCETIKRVALQLLAAGAQLSVTDPLNGHLMPLHYAAESGCTTLVAALLQAGADPGSSTPTGYTVLHAAVQRDGLQVVQQVLAALGSSRAAEMVRVVGSKDPDTCAGTPLHSAVMVGDQKMVEALLAAGADIEQPDAKGRPALHWGLTNGSTHLVPLLLTPGSIRQLIEGYGNETTPLHQAVKCGEWGWRFTLCSSDPVRAYHDPAPLKVVEAVLDAGVDILARDQHGHTALVDVARMGHQDVMELLLKRYPWYRLRQQYQQAGQQLVLDQFLAAGAYALSTPLEKGPLWQMLVTRVADGLGGEAVRTLWAGLKPRVCNLQQPLGSEAEHTGGRAVEGDRLVQIRCRFVRDVWTRCWAPACNGLDVQRRDVTAPLEQLVSCWRRQLVQLEQQQQQQQSGAVGTNPASSGTSLQAMAMPPAAAAAAAGGGSNALAAALQPCSAGSSTPPDAGAGSMEAAMQKLKTAAASGDVKKVHRALKQLPDMEAGLSAAAAAAEEAGHWGLCLGLQRERDMLQEAHVPADGLLMWRSPQLHRLVTSLSTSVVRRLQQQAEVAAQDQPQQQQQQQQQQQGDGAGGDGQQQQQLLQLQAVVQLGDALVEDWLVVREQLVHELNEAMVAAAQAAVQLKAAKVASPQAAAELAAAVSTADAEVTAAAKRKRT